MFPSGHLIERNAVSLRPLGYGCRDLSAIGQTVSWARIRFSGTMFSTPLRQNRRCGGCAEDNSAGPISGELSLPLGVNEIYSGPSNAESDTSSQKGDLFLPARWRDERFVYGTVIHRYPVEIAYRLLLQTLVC